MDLENTVLGRIHDMKGKHYIIPLIQGTWNSNSQRHKGDNWGAFVICILNSKIKKIKSLTVKINDNNSISVMES